VGDGILPASPPPFHFWAVRFPQASAAKREKEKLCAQFFFIVRPGLVPGIHAFQASPQQRRGWPGRARP
jgi:hypothetical protein